MRQNHLQSSDSPSGRLRVLVVAHADEGSGALLDALLDAGFTAETEQPGSPQSLAKAVERGWDVLVTSDEHAGAVRAAVRDCDADVPVVVVRASQGADIATDVQRAFDEATARRERRRVADRLQTSEMRLRAAIEGGFDSFLVFDREVDGLGGVSYRLAEVNSRGAELFGAPKDEIVGKLFDELVIPQIVEFFASRFETVSATGVPLEEEYQTQTPSLPTRWLYLQIVPLLNGIAITARDISERRERDAALRESETKYRALMEQAAVGVFITGPDGRFLEANPAGLRLLGYTLDELLDLNGLDLVRPDQQPAAKESFQRLRAHEPVTAERTLVCKDGSHVDVEVSAATLDDGRMQAIVRDVSERNRQAQALRESEERFVEIVNAVPGVFFTLAPCDSGGELLRFDFVSDGIETLTGYPVDAFSGPDRITLQSLLHPNDRPLIDRTDERLLAGESFAIDIRVFHRDGAVRWAHLKAEPTFDENGTVTSARGVMLDLTDRKQAEEALHLRERAIDALAQGVVITDATRPGKPVVYVNPGYEQLTGYTREELVGQPAMSLAPAVDAAARRELEGAVAQGRPTVREFECRRRDGSTFWCSMLLSPVLDDTGTVTHFVSISSDEGPRRRLEEQFRQAQKLEAVGRVAGGVAHDFNNVLLVIRGYTHVLMTILRDDQEGWAEAKEIEAAATRASELVRHLLAFSRGQVMQAELVGVNEIVLDTQKLVEPLLGNDVEFVTMLATDAGCVKADPARLEQTIVNLVMNARDAMPLGGRLTISTHDVVIADEDAETAQVPPGRYSAITLEDTGVGMDAETKAHVFEPFFSTKEQGRGTGLGLSTAYGFVKQSGGNITVTSAPSEGTSLTILLPHAEDAVIAPLREVPSTQRTLPIETVLLVEDNENARALVARILRESGYDVHDAALPEDALRFCEEYEGPIQLLLSDVVMPQMSGPTLAKQIVQSRPETRVLFVSGYIESSDDVDIISSGGAFLQKPFTPSQLLETVRRILDEPQLVVA